MRIVLYVLLFISASTSAQVDSLSYFANHTDDITCITFSPDGKYIVTGSWDQTIIIHKNDSTAETVQVIEGFRGAVNTIAFSRDGYKMIAGGQDGRLKIFDFNDSLFQIATLDTTIVIENAQINKLIYGPGMRTIFSAGDDGKFITIDLIKDKVMPINGTKAITAAAVAIDRMSFFITTKGSPIINQFDIFGKLLRTFEGHKDDVTDLLVTVDRKYLISSSKDKTIKVWEIANAKEENSFNEHLWEVTDIDMDPFGQYLASGSLDGFVNLYDLKTRKLIHSQELPGHKVNAVSLSPDNTTIMAAAQLEDISNPAGFYSVPTFLPARKIKLPKKINLDELKQTHKLKTEKKLRAKKEAKEAASEKAKDGGKYDTKTSEENEKTLELTEQVKITIKDNE